MGQRVNVSYCILWSMKIYSMHWAYYRGQSNQNNVVSTEMNHIIRLCIAEEISSLCLFAMSYCACEGEGKCTMNMWPQNEACCTKFGKKNHLKFKLYFALKIISSFFQNFKAMQFS